MAGADISLFGSSETRALPPIRHPNSNPDGSINFSKDPEVSADLRKGLAEIRGKHRVEVRDSKVNPGDARTLHRRALALWKNLEGKLVDAVGIIADYELDTAKAIDYPAFNDLTVPETRAMIQALKKATRVKDLGNLELDELSMDRAESFLEAMDELFLAIETAEIHAKKLRWSDLSIAEQKDLALAQQLLTQASDPGNTREARATYYRKLQKVVRKLNKNHGVPLIPEAALAAIEAAGQRQIEQRPTVQQNGTDIMDLFTIDYQRES